MGRTNRQDDTSFDDEDFDAFIEECETGEDLHPEEMLIAEDLDHDLMEDQWLDASYETEFDHEC